MSKRKKIASVAFTGVAAVAVVGLKTGTALAASGTWNVTDGGAGYTGPVSGINSTTATLDANGTKLTCAASTAVASGSVPASTVTGTSPTLGTISTATFGTTTKACTYAGLVNFTAKLNKTVSIQGGTYANGVTTGKLAGSISATLTGVNGTTCSATITGTSIPATYTNATHTLAVNPNSVSTLKITHVSAGHCDGLLTSGEPAAFTAAYKFSPPLSITGP